MGHRLAAVSTLKFRTILGHRRVHRGNLLALSSPPPAKHFESARLNQNPCNKKPPGKTGGDSMNGVSKTCDRTLYCLVTPLPGGPTMSATSSPEIITTSPATVKNCHLRLLRPFALTHSSASQQVGLDSHLQVLSLLSRSPTPSVDAHCQCAGIGVSRVSHRVLCLACCLTPSNALRGLPTHPSRVTQEQVFPGPGFQDGSGTLDSAHQHWLKRPLAAHMHHTQQDSSSEPLSASAIRKAASLRPPRLGTPLSLIPLPHYCGLT